jgi:hypothetical protein
VRRVGRAAATAVVIAAGTAAPAVAEVKVEKVACLNQPNCYRLSNGTVEVVVSTDIGPRILRYAFVGGDNILGEAPGATKTALGEWRAWGGHRLWTAPEAMPRSYAPDNGPVQHTVEGNSIRLLQPVEAGTGIQKEITVTLEPQGTGVAVGHAIVNRGMWPIDVAPWALTIMNGGGFVVIPQHPYKSHSDELLPARALAVWGYTDFTDPRWSFGKRYLRLKTDSTLTEAQKIGVANREGWAAYVRQGLMFVKRFPWTEGATYPDFGVNTETFTAGDFIELETLGPLATLAPGESARHEERWSLFKDVNPGQSEESLAAAIEPLLARTK